MTQLSITGLEKRYGEVPAVRGIDLEVGEGSLVSLLGPSGCGKTTTLRCVAGFETPNAGKIRFDGADVTDLPPEKRDIGMVFQNYALFPHMTVRENLAFGLEMRKIDKGQMAKRIADVMAMVQLGGSESRYPRELSGGQQQRVALARALVIEPKLLLLDEPLANLDAKLRDEMRFFIRSLQRRVGITAMYVTHDQAEAMVMSDQIVVMFDGRIHQIGDAHAVYDRPATRQVANFIGASNLLEGEISAQEGPHWRLRTRLGDVLCGGNSTPSIGAKGTVMIRPEAVALSATAPADLPSFPGVVRERHFLGNLTDYRISLPDGSEFQVQDSAQSSFETGAAIHLAMPADRAWLLREDPA